jgi:hypothetical protein
LLFERAPRRQQHGEANMKLTTTLAIALGVTALTACNNSAKEQAADNIEANAEMTADAIEENADDMPGVTASDNADANADAVREAGEENADAVRDGADADGNSAN